MLLTVQRSVGDRHVVITADGNLDGDAAASLQAALPDAADTGAPILVDLAGVTSISRSALDALAAAQRRVHRAGTSLLLRAEPTQVRLLLASLGIPADDPG